MPRASRSHTSVSRWGAPLRRIMAERFAAAARKRDNWPGLAGTGVSRDYARAAPRPRQIGAGQPARPARAARVHRAGVSGDPRKEVKGNRQAAEEGPSADIHPKAGCGAATDEPSTPPTLLRWIPLRRDVGRSSDGTSEGTLLEKFDSWRNARAVDWSGARRPAPHRGRIGVTSCRTEERLPLRSKGGRPLYVPPWGREVPRLSRWCSKLLRVSCGATVGISG